MADKKEVSGSISGVATAKVAATSLMRLPKEHPFYTMAGRVASEWSHVEHLLDTIIWGLSGGENDRIACITAQIPGVPGRCRAIIALGKHAGINEPTLKSVRSFMSSSFEVADMRARVVHDPWYLQSGKAAQFKTVPFGMQEITEEEVTETIVRIKKLYEKVAELREQIRTELKSLRSKSA